MATTKSHYIYSKHGNVINLCETTYARIIGAENKMVKVELNSAYTEQVSRYYLHSHPDFLIALDENHCIAALSDVARKSIIAESGIAPKIGDDLLQFIPASQQDDFIRSFLRAWAGADIFPDTAGVSTLQYVERFYPVCEQPQVVTGVMYQRTQKNILPGQPAKDDAASRLMLVLEGANMGWWDWNIETGELKCDPKWWAITGYKPDAVKLTAEFKTMFCYPEDFTKIREAFKKVLESPQTNFEIETRIVHKDGPLIPVRLRGFILREESGKPIRITGTMEDLSEKKKAESARERSENYLRTIFQNTETGYIFLDVNLNVLSFNQKASEITVAVNNLPLSTGGRILDYVTEKNLERFTKALDEVYDGQRIEYERSTLTGDNAEEWFYFRLSPVFSLDNKVVNVIMTLEDITERKRDEIQLNKSFELVTAQNKRLLSFSYIVSHNLRSHASNITSIVDFLSEANNEEERVEMIGHLKTVAKSLDETLRNLNDIISVQTSINPIFEPLVLSAFIRRAIDVLSDQVYRKNATIMNNIGNDVVVNYNPAYIESIVLNFISNALKYSQQGRDPIVTIDGHFENGKFVLTVEDNGIGIDLKKNGDKLFGLYKTFNGNPDARGLGLFITRNQVEHMGGRIEVESEPGVGTKFKIFL